MRIAGEIRLKLELCEGTWRTRSERKLEGEPFSYFTALFSEIETLDSDDPTVHRGNEERLVAIGTRLAQVLLSETMLARLALRAESSGKESPARTLLIVSDDPWIPWEALYLPEAGCFLGEAFALSVWTWDMPGCRALPLTRIGTVFPPSSNLEAASKEHDELDMLAQSSSRRVERISPLLGPVLEALRSEEFSGLHFSGHGSTRGSNPDLWSLPLENSELRAVDLSTCDVRSTRPFVFLNVCRSGRSGLALIGLGGLAHAFLEAGAGTVVGTRWAVRDQRGLSFSRSLYRALFEGRSLGEAALLARRELRKEFPGDPSWLAYTAFGDPIAATGGGALQTPPPRRDEVGLAIPFSVWNPEHSSPGALLRADHGIVPFHGRHRELEELHAWCSSDRPIGVRLYTGRGGIGKTRLAIELCRQLRALGWRCGFIPSHVAGDGEAGRDWARDFLVRGGPLLAVVDYAERRDKLLVPLLQELVEMQDGGPYRLILLSRELGDWWDQLRASPGRTRDPLTGPAVSHRPLGPLADQPEQRAETFWRAARAFAEQLGKTLPEQLPADLGADHHRVVLVLHMAALGAVEGVQLKGEDGVLDWVLDRERTFWHAQVERRGIPPWLVRGVGRAMAVVTLAGGVPSPSGALELLSCLRYFAGQGVDVLTEVSHLLHETYPGDFWICPLQPDILGEHLIERETGEDREAIEILFGPKRSAN